MPSSLSFNVPSSPSPTLMDKEKDERSFLARQAELARGYREKARAEKEKLIAERKKENRQAEEKEKEEAEEKEKEQVEAKVKADAEAKAMADAEAMAKAANPRNKTRPKPRPKAKAKVFADADAADADADAADVDVEVEAVDAEAEVADADVEAADARVKEKEKTAKGRLGAEEAGPGEVATEPAMAAPEEMEVDVDVGGRSNGDDGRDVGEEKRENGEDKDKTREMEDPSSQIQWDHRLNTLCHPITTENNDSEEDRSPKETGTGLDTIVVKPCIPLGKGKKKALLSPEVPKSSNKRKLTDSTDLPPCLKCVMKGWDCVITKNPDNQSSCNKCHWSKRKCTRPLEDSPSTTKKAKMTAPADPTPISQPQAGGSKNIGVASTSKSTSRTHSSSAFAKSTACRPTPPIFKSRSHHSASALAKSTTRCSTPSVAGTSTSAAATSPKS